MRANVTKMRGVALELDVAEGKKECADTANDQALPAHEHHPGIGDPAVKFTGADVDKAVSPRDIKVRNSDSRGLPITKVYIKQSDEYAIYKCNGEIMIAYADDPDKAKLQRKSILPLARSFRT